MGDEQIMSFAQVEAEELEPELYKYFSSYEEYKEEFKKFCYNVDKALEMEQNKQKTNTLPNILPF